VNNAHLYINSTHLYGNVNLLMETFRSFYFLYGLYVYMHKEIKSWIESWL